MLEIRLENISKRFIYDWIIRHFNHTFQSGSVTGITGINGSGKSTLIKMISGYLSPSEGAIVYTDSQKPIKREKIFKQVSMAAPYTDLINEYSMEEMFHFHQSVKSFRSDISLQDFKAIVRLDRSKTKQIQFYSSGMKQRLQLALAVLTDSRILLLDEPTSFLDSENKKWFYELLQSNLTDRTVIVASNDDEDFQFCKDVLTIA